MPVEEAIRSFSQTQHSSTTARQNGDSAWKSSWPLGFRERFPVTPYSHDCANSFSADPFFAAAVSAGSKGTLNRSASDDSLPSSSNKGRPWAALLLLPLRHVDRRFRVTELTKPLNAAPRIFSLSSIRPSMLSTRQSCISPFKRYQSCQKLHDL